MNRRIATSAIATVVVALALAVAFGNDVAIALESDAPSVSVGRKSSGRLEHGKRLPTTGPNFRAYSRLGALLGRNAMHGDVRAAILDAYLEVERTVPGMTFVYGESGWPTGGRIRPHRTHQNGLSVDFMVPVRSTSGEPAEIPTAPWRKFGYGLEFDSAGRAGDTRIDFEAIAAHLRALDVAARHHDLEIELVIFAPELRRRVAVTDSGRAVVERLPWMMGTPWVRHDEHYHVDFRVA